MSIGGPHEVLPSHGRQSPRLQGRGLSLCDHSSTESSDSIAAHVLSRAAHAQLIQPRGEQIAVG